MHADSEPSMQTVVEQIHLVRADVMVMISSNVIYNVLPVGGAANTLMLRDNQTYRGFCQFPKVLQE